MHVNYVFISKCSFLSVVRRYCCFRGWKKSHRPGIPRKGMFAWPIHFVAFDGCWWIWVSDSILSGSHTGESVLTLQVKMWKRESVFEDEVFIENTCLGVGSKKRRTKFKRGRSFKTLITWFSWPIISRDWLFMCVRHLCFGNKWHAAHFEL